MLCILICLMGLGALGVRAEVSLKAILPRTSIFLGESFNLNLEVNGADKGLEHPHFPALPPAQIRMLGEHSNSRSSIVIVNGRVTRESFQGRVFAFQIKPDEQGAFHTGPIQVKYQGKTYTHPSLAVQVAGMEQQDTVIAALSASSTSVLVEEPFTITLSIAVKELPPPYGERHEPLHPRLLPRISANFLELGHEMAGIKGTDLNQTLNSLIERSGRYPAFAINNYQSRDMGGFGGFGSLFDEDPFRSKPIRFRLESRRERVDGEKYRLYTLALNYTPTLEGEFTFGPLSFKGEVLTDVQADNQPVVKNIYTIGPAVTVRVVPPPDLGRPECFIGSVGKEMRAEASFDATVCKVGDPLTLVLEITGEISLANMRTPVLNLQTNLSNDFRIYDDNVSAETLSNGKRFKYRVRPTREGTLEFPPIELAFYDTGTRTYTTISTAPIPVQAQPTTQIATIDEPSTNTAYLLGRLTTATTPVLPAGITLEPRGAKSVPLLPPARLMLTLLVAAPLLCALVALSMPLSRLAKKLGESSRKRKAAGYAIRALRRSHSPEASAQALRLYLTKRLDIPGDALTPEEITQLLISNGVDNALAEQGRTLLAQLDEAMFRPGGSSPQAVVTNDLQEVIQRIEAELERKDF